MRITHIETGVSDTVSVVVVVEGNLTAGAGGPYSRLTSVTISNSDGYNRGNSESGGSGGSKTVSVTIHFDGSGSRPANHIRSYIWSFGDGKTGRDRKTLHAYKITVGGENSGGSRSYDVVRTFIVILTVKDRQGNLDIDSTSVTITIHVTEEDNDNNDNNNNNHYDSQQSNQANSHNNGGHFLSVHDNKRGLDHKQVAYQGYSHLY